MMAETYRSEDAQQILQLAIARQAEAGELSREQLFEIAAELNISSADLQAAEQDWLLRQGELQERKAFDLFRYGKFQQRLARYVIVNGFLFAISLLLGWHGLWFISLVWGVGVALDAWRTYQLSGEDYEEAFQRWQHRRLLKKSFYSLLNRWLKGR